jgi:outer membrane protein TolC
MLTRRSSFVFCLGQAIVIASLQALFVTCASAQIGAQTAVTPATQATPLPLSGRSSQTGGVAATEAPVPSTTASVNTLNPSVSIQGPYAGSVKSTAQLPFSGKLSLAEAIQRGTEYNLGAVGMNQALLQARSQARGARSALMPNIRGDVTDTEETVNLRTFGFNFSFPGGVTFPAVVGPFNILDLRARVSQTVADFTALNNYRSAQEVARAGQLSAQDARDLIVLGVAGEYLQVIAADARLHSARAQLDTANALYERTLKQKGAGQAAELDVNRSHVEVLTDQQRLATLENDLAKQKIILARITGLPPNPDYQLSDDIPYAPAQSLTLEDAVKQALAERADLKAAEAQVKAGERALAAARAERYPSASAGADYGGIGMPSSLRGTYTVSVTLNVPIWNGGRTGADIGQAEAVLAQRRAELEDTRSQIESDVRNAFLDLQAAASQVEVSQQNIALQEETLRQTRTRFEAGVSENVEVVQSQESVAGANLDYINSVFAYNLAKLSLARALGDAAAKLGQFLPVQHRP